MLEREERCGAEGRSFDSVERGRAANAANARLIIRITSNVMFLIV